MNISTTKEILLGAITLSERLVGKKESLPVLSCILFEAGDRCSARATNLEAGIEVFFAGEVKEKGSIALPATVISQTVRSLPSGTITLRSEGSNIILESKGSTSLIKAVPADEFPPLNTVQTDSFTLPRAVLLQGLQSVVYATSHSMIRPELGSVLLRVKDGAFFCVATDSFRLAEKKITGVGGEDRELLLPLKHTQELMHTLEHVTGDSVELSVQESQLTARVENVTFIARVVEGSFPNYQEVIPKTFPTEITALTGDIVDVLRKARIFAGNEQHVGVHIYPHRKICTFTAQSQNIGEMSDALEVAASGDDIDVNFHIGYVSDCLSHIPADSVTLAFAGPGRPLVLRGVGDGSFTYLVMPLTR